MFDGVHEILKMIGEDYGPRTRKRLLGLGMMAFAALCGSAVLGFVWAIWALLKPLAVIITSAVPALQAGKPIVTSELWAQFIVQTVASFAICAFFFLVIRRVMKLNRESTAKLYDSMGLFVSQMETAQRDFASSGNERVAEFKSLLEKMENEKREIEALLETSKSRR